MARQIAVSFESETVKIIYASVGRNKIKVLKAISIKDDEFDEFLIKEKNSTFTIINDFKVFYQDILLLPPVKDNMLERLIESEIRKKAVELKDFSYVYNIIEERIQGGKRSKEVFVFAASVEPDGELHKIIERFARLGKTISCLYPSSFALLPLVASTMSDDIVLCVSEAGMSKTLFLIKNGRLCFVRTVQSFESGIHDFDVQNINMTINYCRQTLRVAPSKVIFMNGVSSIYDATMDLLAPPVSMFYPVNIALQSDCDAASIASFLAPISALLYAKELGSADIMPQSYKDINLQKKLFSFLTLIFILLSAIGFVYLTDKVSDIEVLNKRIESARSEFKRMEAAKSDYEDREQRLQKIMPLIQYINSAASSPDIRRALIAISELKAVQDVNIVSINIKPDGESVRLDIKGSVRAESFADAYRKYQGIISAVKHIKGMELVSERLEFKSRDFQMNLKYREKERNLGGIEGKQ